MAHFLKNNKQAFGWTCIGEEGHILIPPEALEAYGFSGEKRVILISGSKSHGGLGITSLSQVSGTPLEQVLRGIRSVSKYEMPAGGITTRNGTGYCWSWLAEGKIQLKIGTVYTLGMVPGTRLLAVRENLHVLSLIAKGPLFTAAKKIEGLADFSKGVQ